MTPEELRKRIQTLTEERDNFRVQANVMIGQMSARIEVYAEWLATLEQPTERSPVLAIDPTSNGDTP